MPTLDEACRTLRLSRKTLRKWLDRLSIEPQQHPYDQRFYTITDEDLQRVKDARAQMPGARQTPTYTPAYIPSESYKALRAKSDEETVRDVSPSVVSLPRRAPLQRESFMELPDGMMGKQDAALRHGLPLTTLRRWVQEGKIETARGEYGGMHGQFLVRDPLTRRGLAQLYHLASRRPDFRRCADCPHDAEAGAPDVSDEPDELLR